MKSLLKAASHPRGLGRHRLGCRQAQLLGRLETERGQKQLGARCQRPLHTLAKSRTPSRPSPLKTLRPAPPWATSTIREPTPPTAKEIAYQANGADVKSAATWDGDALQIDSKASVQGMDLVIKDKIRSADDGKTMTDTVHIATSQGDLDLSLVFDKQ